MEIPKAPYIGDAEMRRFLKRHDCPTPFHVVRMRFWGAIVGPAVTVSPASVIQGLWPDGLPRFEDSKAVGDFFQTLLGLWNRMAKLQDESPGPTLDKVGRLDTREGLRKAAALRVEELRDGFLMGLLGSCDPEDMPPKVGEIVGRMVRGTEILAKARNTFAAPPGPDDKGIVAEFTRAFPEFDRAFHADLGAIAAESRRWRQGRPPPKPKRPGRRKKRH